MAFPINAGQVATDAFMSGLGAAAVDAFVEVTNAPFLNQPAVVGQGMTNVELLLYGSGALALAGSIFSLVSKRKLLGGAESNAFGYGIGLIFGTFFYENQLSKLIRGG
jgi:hypothetical protein